MKLIARRGCTEIFTNRGDVVISYHGNMGASEERNVRPDVDALYGAGTYDRVRPHGQVEGSPDYSFHLTVPRQIFFAA